VTGEHPPQIARRFASSTAAAKLAATIASLAVPYNVRPGPPSPPSTRGRTCRGTASFFARQPNAAANLSSRAGANLSHAACVALREWGRESCQADAFTCIGNSAAAGRLSLLTRLTLAGHMTWRLLVGMTPFVRASTAHAYGIGARKQSTRHGLVPLGDWPAELLDSVANGAHDRLYRLCQMARVAPVSRPSGHNPSSRAGR